MGIVLIPVFFALLWILFFTAQSNDGLRVSFLKTVLTTFSFVAVTTEILSLFHLINANFLILVWLAAVCALVFSVRGKMKNGVREMWNSFCKKIVEVPRFYLVILVGVYSITLMLALFSPPNTSDSMTYHLARVANWIQNGAVEFYPTAIIRQLYQPPLAEYAILHLQLLGGGDYFANLVQWFSLVAGGAAISLIVLKFGEDLKTQSLAVVFCATLPTAIVQASGTQNDLVVTLFVVAFFYFWTRAAESGSWTDSGWTGISLALAILTKGTAYIFCLPVGLFFVLWQFFALKNSARRRFVLQWAFVLLIAFAFNAAQYARNYKLFGSPVSTANEEVRNKNLTPPMLFSNIARNYAIHLGTYSETLRTTLEGAMKTAFGDELKNPDSTWLNNEFGINYSTHEDLTGNFVHILLITVALILFFFVRGTEKTYVYGAALAIFGGFILFSALLKWQIYASRLQMPLFFFGCALTACVIARILPRTANFLVVICLIFALPPLFTAEPRSFFTNEMQFALTAQTREQRYFTNPATREVYTEAADFIKQQNPESVGLMLMTNDLEYALWILLKNDFRAKPLICHVGVPNVSSNLKRNNPPPQFIISMRGETSVEGVEYKEVWKKGNIRILQKQ